MLEAKLAEAGVLKKLLDAIKELVSEANFECNEEGIHLQAMDNSHVALVAVKLESSGFKRYRCDRPMPLGVNLGSLTKVLKCAKDDDQCIIKAADEADVLNLVYEARNSDRIAEYDMKLMEIETDTLTIPETEYDARITMPSAEFARIVRDLNLLGESVRIDISKEGVRFAADGEAANGSVLLKPTDGAGIGKVTKQPKKEEDAGDAGDAGDEDEEKTKVKKEKPEDEDVEMDEDEKDNEDFKPGSDVEAEAADSDDEESGKKRKKKTNGTSKPSKKAKTSSSKGKAKKSDEEDDGKIVIEMNQHVNLTFSLKYLVNFSKSSGLCKEVQLMLSNDVPLLVSYDFGQGSINYYLAPKIGDD